MSRGWWIALVVCFALDAHAQGLVVDSVWREATYDGGLEQPGMMGDSATSSAFGSFDESYSDSITSPGYGDAAADAAQLSVVEMTYGGLRIDASGDAGGFATSLASGAVADSLSWVELEVVFTATENVLLEADLVVSSDLGLFYDGPGAGVVETSHVGSILICEVGIGCLADVLVEDLTDNGMGVADGVLDSAWIPPGQYVIELLAVSQTISRDVGSASGSSGFSGEIRVRPAPEPASGAMLVAGLLALVAVDRRRRGVQSLESCTRGVARARSRGAGGSPATSSA